MGYLKGRNISNILRNIDDVIDYLNMSDKAGYLLALDYCKAFDSISKDFIIEAFKLFGFGEQFTKWVKTNKFSSINYGGWLSEPFNVNCGIRQGCPFSPLAFVLAIEILAIKIRNSSIKGIELPKLKDLQINIKCRQLADDTSLFLKDENYINTASNVIEEFYCFSGLKLNFHKTKLMKIGHIIQDDTDTPSEIVDKIKVLGLVFENGKRAIDIDENWAGRIEELTRIIQLLSLIHI